MESAKVVNKILLISLAFGSVTFVAGMLAEKNIQKALIGTSAAGSMASVAGALVSNSKKNNNQEDKLLDSQVAQLRSQENQLQQSFEEATARMQAVETDINSLQTEHNQLLSIISDLNSQKQQLETEYNSKKQEIEAVNIDISVLKNHQQNLKFENDSLESKIEELSFKHEQLEQVISPIEESIADVSIEEKQEPFPKTQTDLEVDYLVSSLNESELEVFNSEAEITKASVEHTDETTVENAEANINLFSSGSPESNEAEKNSDSEIVEELIGAFDESELEMFEHKSTEAEQVVNEESDFDLEEETYGEQVEYLISSVDEPELEMFDHQASSDSIEDDNYSELLESKIEESAIASEPDQMSQQWSNESESDEFSSEAEPAIASEPDQMSQQWSDEPESDEFMAGWADDSESSVEELMAEPEPEFESESDEFSLEAETAIASEPDQMSQQWGDEPEPDDFMTGWADDSESSVEELLAEPEEFAQKSELEEMHVIETGVSDLMRQLASMRDLANENNFSKESNREDAFTIESESDDFMAGWADDSESSVEELMAEPEFESEPEEIIQQWSAESDDFIMEEFTDERESTEELDLEETSTTESEFDDLMGAFAEDSQLVKDEPAVDSEAFDFNFKDRDEDSDELDSIDSVDQKLNELIQVSDESLGELNDLLESVQVDELEEARELDKIHQDNKINN